MSSIKKEKIFLSVSQSEITGPTEGRGPVFTRRTGSENLSTLTSVYGNVSDFF